METPEEAKKRKAATLRREVVRLVTPGTVTEDALLEAARPAWLLALAPGEGGTVGAAWLDVSTGAFETGSLPAAADLPGLLVRWVDEVLYLLESRDAVLGGVSVRQVDAGRAVGAIRLAARGDRELESMGIKAATLHRVRFEQGPDGAWSADVYLDV
jgi:DNA mismatch repair protein MutS